MNTRVYLMVVLCGVTTGLATPARGAENPHVWRPTVRSVAVFKNGTGFFVRTGAVELNDGWCYADPVPPALFGTLAFYAMRDDQRVDLVGSGRGEVVDFATADEPPTAAAKAEALRPLLGLEVQLVSGPTLRETTAAGTLREVTTDYAILEFDTQLSAVPLADLRRAEVLNYPIRMHVEAGDATEAELGMAYLRKGITWIPEYTLEIIDDTTAELTLRATLVNEAEDLVDADVHFVVGVPSFLLAEYLSPLAVGQAIRTVAAALPPGFQAQMVANNAIMNRAALANDNRADASVVLQDVSNTGAANAMSGLPQLGGAAGSDFSVYTRSHMTVRRGEKALVTIFKQQVRYAHRYHWESPGALRHLLVLHNETDSGWTTGPIIAISGPRPLCQDTLYYTPAGSNADLPVTTAINVGTSASESETDRALKAHEPQHNVFFDLVTIQGTLTLVNHESRAIDVAIHRQVPGLLETASDDGRLQQDTSELRLLQRRGSVDWRIKLEPGERRTLTYTYKRYVESR